MSAHSLEQLVQEIRNCRVCVDQPKGKPLAHDPRPVLRVSASARIAICGQAPGTRVHASGKPFTDPSGDRLRAWLGVTSDEFYDTRHIAIVPMGFCFPGLDKSGGDLPPRRECAPLWRKPLFDKMPNLELMILVGSYAQRWHLPRSGSLTDTVADWRAILDRSDKPRYLPLPHPSWRNNAWLKKNPWFERDVLPALRRQVRELLKDAA